MSGNWYRLITSDETNFTPIAEFVEYMEAQYLEAEQELRVKGKRIDDIACRLPGIVTHRFAQLQEIESILNHLQRLGDKAMIEAKDRFLNHYARTVSERTAEKHAEVDPEVYAIRMLQGEVALIRNKFLALTKGMEYLHFQTGNIVRLKVAGIEDTEF